MAFDPNNFKNILKELPKHVRLIAASKTRTAEDVIAAKEAGITHFGENYVQEAEAKAAKVAGVTWHLIGPLQSNKVNKAIKIFEVFHTVDRLKLLNKLNKAAQKHGKTPDIFLQVNIGREEQKAGVLPEDLDELVKIAQGCENLNLVGLMAIHPAHTDPKPFFIKLKELAETHSLPRLSMGMSGDWHKAVKHGATDIRLGTALFGQRV